MNRKNKKSILYLITQSELGGAQTYVFDLAKNLKHEFNVFVAYGEQGDKGEIAQRLNNEGIETYTIPHLKRQISPLNDLIALFEIRKLIKKLRPDIIHLNSSKISILGSIASLFTKSKIDNRKSTIVYTVHGWVFNEPMPSWKKLFYKYAEKFSAFFKDKLICVSEFDKQIAINEKICKESKLVTIHNGIEKIDFLPREDAKSELLKFKQWEFDLENSFLIGIIGNFYNNKGYEYLIKSFKNLIHHGLDVKLIIIGRHGDEENEVIGLINKLKLKSHVLITKPETGAKYLQAFDMYVCSSVKEGLSYTLIEAMQAGLPIVATEVGGNPELISNNETGLLVESKDKKQLFDAMKKLIVNHDLANKLGENARKKSLKYFTLDRMISKTKELYN